MNFKDDKDIRKFMFAGNATFTILNEITEKWFTFKVQAKKDGKGEAVRFVKLRTGDARYEFIGSLFDKSETLAYFPSKKSRIKATAPSNVAFAWFCRNIKELPETFSFHHEGKCGACGRKLTNPESIESGYGPICREGMEAV